MGVVSFKKLLIEKNESYNKQSYRNRTVICATQGPQALIVPVQKNEGRKKLITEVRIDYRFPWLQQHKRALVSAYNSSPFFEFYQDELFEILDREYEYLFDLNLALMEKIMELTGISREIGMTEDFVLHYPEGKGLKDCRYLISPKLPPLYTPKPYYQVFSPKQGFVSGLSIVDLLFNEGPESVRYLR